MTKHVLFYLIGSFVLVVGFQNCGGVDFSESNTEGVLAAKEAGADDQAHGQLDQGRDPVAEEDSDDDQDSSQDDHGKKRDPASDKECKDSRLYVCVLEGSGKSIRLGYVDGKLEGKLATPQDVCMTKKACSEIVSQAFDVKGPEKRGFCPDKNPHVVSFSDAELKAMIDKILKP